ncbi:leucyl aminopeptidase [Aggregatibacter actinomycetemcomitans]|uniref:leucyl aminopeptidase n=1 Tax=Aggregatibacter actinomycetemcomitans TaxID=714 RepID=UPI00197C6329|nr:leucyl aminopeptidase [Aggregatibacter actinomycetemcomitans]MBN6074100.1 leucyl aminopeptidase [Aggregatibacter actinomycetemcomitans]
MKYSAQQCAINQPADCLIVGIFEEKTLSKSAVEIDNLSGNYLSDLVESGEISGKLGQTALLRHVPNIAAERVLVVGCGKAGDLNERQYKQLIQKTAQALKETQAKSAVSFLTEIPLNQRALYWNIRFAMETIEQDLYQFTQFKSQKTAEKSTALCEVIFNVEAKDQTVAEQAIQHASAIALGVRVTKDVANCPPNVCTPNYLADKALDLAKHSPLIKTTIVNEADMEKLGMGAYLAVSRGSRNEAKLSIMEYRNASNPNAKPIVLVGKGLTFDAGGISLKPAADMDEMKYDMCGAASVYGVMSALAQLQLPLNVIGVMAGCENLPDGNAYRPGDILTTMNGLTVEVLNTDAEGRLVLCDTLTYVERFDPEVVIDIATLTGACVVALGQHNSGLISPHDDIATAIEKAAQQSADKAWRLPLSEEYQEQLKSNFADLANLGGRWGGTITASAFLANFTKKYPWAHLDIAGTAWLQGANKGATGRPVSLLVQFLLNQVK